MALFELFRTRGESPVARRRRRKTEGGSAFFRFLEHNRLVALAVFFLTVAAIFTLSFVGVNPTAFRIIANQTATIRIVADANFSYPSKILTERARERKANEIPMVFTVDHTVAKEFEQQIRGVLEALRQLDAVWAELGEAERSRRLEGIVDSARSSAGIQISVRDLSTIMGYGDFAARENLINNGLFVLSEIMQGGVYDPSAELLAAEGTELLVFHVKRDSGEIGQARVTLLDDAQTYLQSNLRAENVPDPVHRAVYRVLRGGLKHNLVPDEAARNELRERALANLRPVIVQVEQGRSIIEPNTQVTPEQVEMLHAYQEFLNLQNRLPTGMDRETIGRILLVLGVIIVAGFYIRLEDPMTLRSNSRLALLALVLVFSLSLVRLTLEWSSSGVVERHPELGAILPYIAPVAFAPMVIAVLIGAGPALFSGLLISVFSAIIFGNRLEVLVLSLVTATVAAYDCRAVRRRSRVVRAGWLSGLALTAFALLHGWTEGHDFFDVILKAMIGAQAVGIFTGIVVVGLLPVLEALFKRTTDITLLELTDFNHPLLRRMQMEAPGTYHHSLMVASLAENAANEIGANALLCRVCCMFHDIGKLVKPEYFAENQRDGANPHVGHSASLSALIIKSHVKEGVDLAIKHRLPRPVIDVIRQHHGTTLIRYFYEQARQQVHERAAGERGDAPTPPDPQAALETTFRYDGPRPRFKESAIILFADSVEAASRSLQKVSPQAVEDLIERIIRDKVDDGQIDHAPLTIQEIAHIKRSFTFTLLNSLHARIVYPRAERPPPASAVTTRSAAPTRTTPAAVRPRS